MIRVDFSNPPECSAGSPGTAPVFRCAFDAAVNEVGSGRVDGGVKGDDLTVVRVQ